MTPSPRVLFALPLVALVGCASAVQSTYVQPGYNAKAEDALKRIAVVAWAPAEHPKLAELLASVAEDRIKLKMSYLVYQTGPLARGWSDACGKEPCPVIKPEAAPAEAETEADAIKPEAALEPAPEVVAEPAAPAGPTLEGVLSIRAYDVTVAAEVKLHLVAELHSCATGALLWRADGSEGNPAKDEDLTALTKSYIANLGAEVERYAAPAFLVMRDMLDTLPDVVLTDDEVMEKIELE